jgi:hypothetical protein
MSTEVRYNSKSLRLLYYRYKDSPYFSLGLHIGIILIAIMLLLWVVLPQIQEWFSIRNETVVTQERIKTIRGNTQYALSYDGAQLENQVMLASTAIPPEKEFINILSAITASALNAKVSLLDYDFAVGELSKTVKEETQYPTKVELTVIADILQITNFIKELEEKIPLSRAELIEINENNSVITINFAYVPYPEVQFVDSQPIQPLTDQQRVLLETLKKWHAQLDAVGAQSASPAAIQP